MQHSPNSSLASPCYHQMRRHRRTQPLLCAQGTAPATHLSAGHRYSQYLTRAAAHDPDIPNIATVVSNANPQSKLHVLQLRCISTASPAQSAKQSQSESAGSSSGLWNKFSRAAIIEHDIIRPAAPNLGTQTESTNRPSTNTSLAHGTARGIEMHRTFADAALSLHPSAPAINLLEDAETPPMDAYRFYCRTRQHMGERLGVTLHVSASGRASLPACRLPLAACYCVLDLRARSLSYPLYHVVERTAVSAPDPRSSLARRCRNAIGSGTGTFNGDHDECRNTSLTVARVLRPVPQLSSGSTALQSHEAVPAGPTGLCSGARAPLGPRSRAWEGKSNDAMPEPSRRHSTWRSHCRPCPAERFPYSTPTLVETEGCRPGYDTGRPPSGLSTGQFDAHVDCETA
ncbi:hypothetical protein BS50DRAFT_223211 [Corynespora cassiicola Philippines]|uniref:Uncharacterized protein n=1 Tax=Corynespora cassiicola Philippines TaxID=1448308 RepID=A0A2T2N393_CORCC|nr:hypothetical protein BS50DRAFT_223211 [Corynespora cassiicola Philippines]